MRLAQSTLVLVTSSLLIAACSSNSNSNNNNGKGGNPGGPTLPQAGTVAAKAVSGEYNQAVIDDLNKAADAADAVLPATVLLTDKDSQTAQENQSKLNKEGQTWLSTMREKCVVTFPVTPEPVAPDQNQNVVSMHADLVTTVAGDGCPISLNTHVTMDSSEKLAEKTSSSDVHAVANETVLDPGLIRSSGLQVMASDILVHTDMDQNTNTMHQAMGANINGVLRNSDLHASAQQEITMSGDNGMSVATYYSVTTAKGHADFGMVRDEKGSHYYMGSKEVSQEEFEKAVGQFSKQSQEQTSKN